MNTQPRTFEFKPAARNRTSLIIAIGGASGSGKTRSALAIGRGICGGSATDKPEVLLAADSKIAMIDTEACRGLHYAPPLGANGVPLLPTAETFAFRHVELASPFTPEAYIEAIDAADKAGFEVIIVDSCSHEYEGAGGIQDIHDALVEIAVERSRTYAKQQNWNNFDEDKAREKANVGAWKDPKQRHKRFVGRLLQCRAHLILCLRAEEKIRIETVTEKTNDGREYKKTVIVQPKDMPLQERWVPICEKRFMYEMTLSMILTPQNPGVPIPVKLQEQHRPAVALDKPISEGTGRALASWANGGSLVKTSGPDALLTAGRSAAAQGGAALDAWILTLTKDEKARARTFGAELRYDATEVDAEREAARQRDAAEEADDAAFNENGDQEAA